MTATQILIIEDEPEIRKFLRVTLEQQGYAVTDTMTGSEGLKRITTYPPELVILDLGLPDMDGTEIIGKVREWSRVPIIVLSAREREQDKVNALEAGADDYPPSPAAAFRSSKRDDSFFSVMLIASWKSIFHYLAF